MTTLTRKWYEIIWWWEIRRVLYNVIMLAAGTGSFYIGYVTIPLIYTLIGIGLDLVYTFGWIGEILVNKFTDKPAFTRQDATIGFIFYLILSVLIVAGFAFWIAL